MRDIIECYMAPSQMSLSPLGESEGALRKAEGASRDAWKLHCAAMERTMLHNHRATVNAYYLSVGECSADDAHGLGILSRLSVSRNEHRTIKYHEVGVGRRKSLSVLNDSVGHRQAQQIIRLA